MSKKQDLKKEELQRLMYFRIIIICSMLYFLTFLASDIDHLPTIAETMRFILHMISRLGDLLHIIGTSLNKPE